MESSHRPMDSPCFPLLFLFLLPLLSSVPGGAADLASDKTALLALRAAVGPFTSLWNSSSSPCAWPGVVCSGERVTELHLPATGLRGQIPAGLIGNLTALQILSLRFNSLSGTLPSDLANCTQLRSLNLESNSFSGEIPPAIFSLRLLVRLSLAANNFSGPISTEFDQLTRLRTLYIDRNQLTGEIPSLNLTNLEQFNVSYNQLNGSVPAGPLSRMPASSFLGMPLCGGPLGPCSVAPSPAPIPGTAPATPTSPASPTPPTSSTSVGGESESNKLSGGAVAGIAIGCVFGFLILLALLLLLCRRRSSRRQATDSKSKDAEATMTNRELVGMQKGQSTYALPPATASVPAAVPAASGAKKLVFVGKAASTYDIEDLLRASAEVLGKGTFGTTYKAVLETGPVVAVKRLKDINLPEREFREKIGTIGAMDHVHLVPLQAYYYSKDEKLLVYDFVPMGSLSSLIHGYTGTGRAPLSFEERTRIALSAARGIEYIHSTGPRASHGHITSSNVLLSASGEARISDQGLAKLSTSPTLPNRGSGYRAPEVTDVRKVSQTADVYSFGVLLLEMLTGKAPAHTVVNDEGVDLPRWVQSVVREEWTAEVFDIELVKQQVAAQEMMQMLQLAMDCTVQYPDKRPSMLEVVARIDEIRASVLGRSRSELESGQ